MKKENSNIVIFTLDFPYTLGESFLELEIEILAKKIDKIYIIPSRKAKHIRCIPKNVEVIDIITNSSREISLTLIAKKIKSIFSIFIYSLFHENFYKYIKHWKSFLHYIAIEFNRLKVVESFIKSKNLYDAIYYDYWFVNNTLLLTELKKKGLISIAISRAHGFDLFDERQYEGIVPFRKYKTKHLSKIFLISNDGLDYFKTKINKKYWSKAALSYLGVKIPKLVEKEKKRKYKLVVSCSRLIPTKQIHLIIKSLSLLKLNIEWIHFGDGELRNELFKLCDTLPKNIEYTFFGEVDNSFVLDFYKSNCPDLFISMSIMEGLPVSIMEALSYGIPVVAINVNGIPELINEENGILILPKNADKNHISHKIADALYKKWNRKRIIDIHAKKFDGQKNYLEFAKKLHELLHK